MPMALPADKRPLPETYSGETAERCERTISVIAMRRIEHLCEEGLEKLAEAEEQLRSTMPRESDPEWTRDNASGLTCERLFSKELNAIFRLETALETLLMESYETMELYRCADEVGELPKDCRSLT